MITTIIRIAFYAMITLVIFDYWMPLTYDIAGDLATSYRAEPAAVAKSLLGLAGLVFFGSQVKRSWDERHHGGKVMVDRRGKRTIDDVLNIRE
jgi:hypothetical protein